MARISDQIQVTGAPPAWRIKPLAQKLIAGCRRLGLIEPAGQAVLAISCVGQAEMVRLNARHRGKHAPTDVLSFEQTGAPSPRGLVFLGDLVLCTPVVRAQAKSAGHGVRDEVAVLLAHGLLHLLGHDHERSLAAARRMKKLEEELLGLTGLGLSGLITRSGLEA